jgi:hypothetical protein
MKNNPFSSELEKWEAIALVVTMVKQKVQTIGLKAPSKGSASNYLGTDPVRGQIIALEVLLSYLTASINTITNSKWRSKIGVAMFNELDILEEQARTSKASIPDAAGKAALVRKILKLLVESD